MPAADSGRPQESAGGPQDCLPCRVVGTTVCWGASAALALQLYRGVPPVGGPAHRAMLATFAGAFGVLGAVRLTT